MSCDYLDVYEVLKPTLSLFLLWWWSLCVSFQNNFFTEHIDRTLCFLLPFTFWHIPETSPITSHYQVAEVSDKDYICSLDKDNGMHRCNNFPPFKISETQSCHEKISPSTLQFYASQGSSSSSSNDIFKSFNDTFFFRGTSNSCINWNLYYTDCRPGMLFFLVMFLLI